MLLPITHYLYLALALFGVGLGGALLRRSVVAVVLAVALMHAAVALLLCAYARFFVDSRGQIMALMVLLAGLVELVIMIAIAARVRRAGGDLADWHERGKEEG